MQTADACRVEHEERATNDNLAGEPFEHLEGRDWMGFAGIAPSKVPAISQEEQFAE